MKVYQQIAQSFRDFCNCIKNYNYEWKHKHEERIYETIRDYLPRGSGVNEYPRLDFDRSTLSKLIFTAGFHHIDRHGYYDGWTAFKVIIRPSFNDIDIKIQGSFPRKYSDTRGYLADIFYEALTQELQESK